jgi:predicted dehydrogenase
MGGIRHFNGRYWCDYGADPKAPMSWRYQGGPGSGALADIGSHLIDLAEFVCGPIASVRGAVLSTFVERRALPLGAAVGHAAAELSDVTEPVENEDLVTFTATFASGATGTFSASRAHLGLANSLGFEVFGANAAARYELDHGALFD